MNNLCETAIHNFLLTGKLPDEILKLRPDQISEVIDGIPDRHKTVIAALRELLQREGVC